REQILSLDGFADRSASLLLGAIERSKQVPLERFLMGLGIRQVGQHTARVLARRFQTLEAIMAANRDVFEGVHEIGPEIAASLESFFQEERNRQAIQRLLALGLVIQAPAAARRAGPRPFEGKIVVFT